MGQRKKPRIQILVTGSGDRLLVKRCTLGTSDGDIKTSVEAHVRESFTSTKPRNLGRKRKDPQSHNVTVRFLVRDCVESEKITVYNPESAMDYIVRVCMETVELAREKLGTKQAA